MEQAMLRKLNYELSFSNDSCYVKEKERNS